MSKASEWVAQKIKHENHVAAVPTWEGLKNGQSYPKAIVKSAPLGSEPSMELFHNGNFIVLNERNTLALARWILDTFGETTP
jgi:hypothetical protein